MTPVGVREVCDLTVESANHYITQSTLINKNCYVAYDEIGNLADERAWDFLLTCVRSTDPTIVKMARASANPGGAAHGWLKRRFITPCPPDGTPVFTKSGRSRAFVQARVWDNPTLVKNDPDYVRTLQDLPAVMRAQHLEGDWTVGTGLAFPTVTEESHLVPVDGLVWGNPYGAFDWGFGHKWAFGLFGSGLGGTVVLRDSVMGRGHIPSDIVDRVRDMLDSHNLRFLDLQYTVAGSDVKSAENARGNAGPSIFEQFLNSGWPLMNADQRRVTGYQQCLYYLEYPAGHPKQQLLIVDTPGNRIGTRQLTELVVDPDYPDDVLKVKVDPMTGDGGDDWYDMFRYGLMTRPRALAIQSVTPRSLDRHVPRKTEPDRWTPTSLPRTHPQQLARRSTKID